MLANIQLSKLATIDWAIIFTYVCIALAIGIYYTKKASRSKEDFFLSGRSLPWWLLGTSMAATNFAADTPLAVTGLVSKHGVAGVWFFWCSAIGAVLSTFFFAKLWRRAEVVTDAEIIEMRYSGKEAKGLRLFKGFYFGIIINCFVMGWVMIAMSKIMASVLGWDKFTTLAIFSVITVVYTIMSGFWGVVITDFYQYFLAAGGSIILAIKALEHVGGLSALKTKLAARFGDSDAVISFIPKFGGGTTVGNMISISMTTFLVYVFMQWWAQKYSDGGGKVVQRMSSAKNEKHAVFGTMWFATANYALQVWPWVVTALVALVVFPGLKDPEAGYPMLVMKVLPAGFRGLMVISLIGAFMSTIDTHLNLGASYMVNDMYERFIKPEASQKHYVFVSRVSMIILMAISCAIAWQMKSISGAWKFLIMFSSGAGLTFVIRWLWWRANAWTEIVGMLSSGIIAIIVKKTDIVLHVINMFSKVKLEKYELSHGESVIIVVTFSTICWLIATYLTSPVKEETLIKFYTKVQPSTPWWRDIPEKCQLVHKEVKFTQIVLNFFMGIISIYMICFGTGSLIFYSTKIGLGLLAGGVCLLLFLINRIKENE